MAAQIYPAMALCTFSFSPYFDHGNLANLHSREIHDRCKVLAAALARNTPGRNPFDYRHIQKPGVDTICNHLLHWPIPNHVPFHLFFVVALLHTFAHVRSLCRPVHDHPRHLRQDSASSMYLVLNSDFGGCGFPELLWPKPGWSDRCVFAPSE